MTDKISLFKNNELNPTVQRFLNYQPVLQQDPSKREALVGFFTVLGETFSDLALHHERYRIATQPEFNKMSFHITTNLGTMKLLGVDLKNLHMAHHLYLYFQSPLFINAMDERTQRKWNIQSLLIETTKGATEVFNTYRELLDRYAVKYELDKEEVKIFASTVEFLYNDQIHPLVKKKKLKVKRYNHKAEMAYLARLSKIPMNFSQRIYIALNKIPPDLAISLAEAPKEWIDMLRESA